jgi:hypothetical protein
MVPMTDLAPEPTDTTTPASAADHGIDPMIASELSAEALAALRQSKSPDVALAADQETVTKTTTEPAPEPVSEAEVEIDLSADAEEGEASPAGEADEHHITDEDLNKLPEDFRKKYRGKDAENKRLRTRSQEAEKERDRLRDELAARPSAGGGLENNVFGGFDSAKGDAVAKWVDVAADIQARVTQINFATAKGKEVTDEMLQVTLPNGKVIELDEGLIADAATWEKQAKAWEKHHQTVNADRQSAAALSTKLRAYPGYETALESLRTANVGRETLLSKAALYDMIVAGKHKIKLSSKAVTAAPATKGAGSPSPASVTKTLPPATPGGAAISAPGNGTSDVAAQRARLMKLAEQGDEDALAAALLLRKS